MRKFLFIFVIGIAKINSGPFCDHNASTHPTPFFVDPEDTSEQNMDIGDEFLDL